MGDKLTSELNNIKTAVLAVALSYKKTKGKKYETYKQKLQNQLLVSGDAIDGKPIPFYKKGVKSPAGYVIKTNKEVLICYHGTQFDKIFGSGAKEILHDFQFGKSKMKFGDKTVSVHSGFKREFEASKDSLYEALGTIDKPVHIAGHSLGGAVAQIAALDLATNKIPPITIKQVTTFGGPRVFSREAAELYNEKEIGNKTIRVKQDLDPVPRIVPKGMYHHVGKKIKIGSSRIGIHSGAVYRNMVMTDMKDMHVESARPSALPSRKRSIHNDYVKPLMSMTAAGYLAAQASVSAIKNRLTRPRKVSNPIPAKKPQAPGPSL